MSVARVARLGLMALALGGIALSSGASQANRQEPAVTAPTISPLAGRIAPLEAGYGRFDETIMVQDI